MRELRPAHPGDVAAAKALHPPGEIVGRVGGVRVHARHELAAGVLEPDVERERDPPLRVVENPDTRVIGGEALQHRAGGVLRAPVHEQELDVRVEALGLEAPHGLEDVLLLVEGRRSTLTPTWAPPAVLFAAPAIASEP